MNSTIYPSHAADSKHVLLTANKVIIIIMVMFSIVELFPPKIAVCANVSKRILKNKIKSLNLIFR